MHTCSIPVLQLCTLVRFESSRVPLKFDVVLGDMAAKTCTGVALNCIAFGVPPSLRHPFPPFDSGCRQRRILRLEEVKRSILCSLPVHCNQKLKGTALQISPQIISNVPGSANFPLRGGRPHGVMPSTSAL